MKYIITGIYVAALYVASYFATTKLVSLVTHIILFHSREALRQ